MLESEVDRCFVLSRVFKAVAGFTAGENEGTATEDFFFYRRGS